VRDFQRLVSYGIAAFVSLVVDMPSWRVGLTLTLAVLMIVSAAVRLSTNNVRAPYVAALADLIVSPAAVAIVTGSPVFTVALVAVVSMAIVASFDAPAGTSAISALVSAAISLPIALVIGQGPDGISGSLTALVLTILALAIAMLILVFFSVQTYHLRRTLEGREAQLSSILAVTPVVLATVGADSTITAIAGDVRGWFGLPGDQIPASSDVGAIVTAAARGERVIRDVAIGDRIFSVTCDPGTSDAVLLTAYDITERAEARRRLEGLMRSKDQFIAAISHELRTPLSAVLGFAEEIRDAMAPGDPLRAMIDVVADQSAEMAAIIEDLLVNARTSFEGVPLAPHRIDLADEAAAVVETIGPRLTKLVDRQLDPVEAFADPIRVRQIVRNLLTNADRYGGAKVGIGTYRDATHAVLEISDSGERLTPALQRRIFEPYESSGPIGGQPAAIGLGLAVSRTLAELMSGTLDYRHRDGWSVFELRLPLQAPPPQAARAGPGSAEVR